MLSTCVPTDRVPLDGRSSHVRLAVPEIFWAREEMNAASSNANLLVYAFLSLFDAGNSSPLAQDGDLAAPAGGFRRFDAATR